MVTLDNQLRSSLRVAPLSIVKTGHGSDWSSGRSVTPPVTPNTQEFNMDADVPVFHNFLRAFHPFYPDHVPDTSVTLPLNQGEVVLVHSIHTNGWADGTLLVSGARGWLPTNYCVAYDPDEMGSLLKALLHFWDLLRSTAVNDSELFSNQDFMRGLIAGVRYLLEKTHCLTRESAIVQRHDGLRRSRKSILSELSLLVKTAKRLQEMQRNATPQDEVNDVVDEMILRAFKIVTKGVKFLDLIEEDRRARAPAVSVMATVTEEALPPTPPADAGFDAGSRSGVQVYVEAPEPSEVTQRQRLSAAYSGTNAHRLSQNSAVHRLSSAFPNSVSPQNLVSERLGACHDLLLSHLSAFIGRLQVQSPSPTQLARAAKQTSKSGGALLVVFDVICSGAGTDGLHTYRAATHHRLRDLLSTALDIVVRAGPEMEDVILPPDTGRLLLAATGCVKATGECVAKTKWVLEKIGDFEFEFDHGDLCYNFDLDMAAFDRFLDEKVDTVDTASLADSSVSEAATASTTSTASVLPRTVIDKPLPLVPRVPPLPEDDEEPFPGRLSLTQRQSSLSSLRPSLPPLPRLSTAVAAVAEYSPTDTSEPYQYRVESMTASAGSASTYISRDSESSLVSQTSTRATTPDSHTPHEQPSLGQAEDDVETQVLEKTFAHELIFNKEGQVVGGSLAALVERLTTHEATPDALFVSTFYLTFRLFCTPVQFAEALIDRFEYVGEHPYIANPVRLRTYNVFKGWLESHWREDDREALPTIRLFAENTLNTLLPSAGRRLLELTGKVSSIDGALVPRLVSSMGKTSTVSQYVPLDTPMPGPVLSRAQGNMLAQWKAGGVCPVVTDFEPLELARQLTLKQMAMFCSIMPDELLGSRWTKNGGIRSPHVKAMSTFTTGLSNLVADTILQYDEVKKRAAVIKHWVKIAHQCLSLHNYDALMAITCALDHTSIKRLRMTWDAVSAKRKDMLHALQSIVDFTQNHKVLRARLQDHVPPCLPFLGILLTDLTFIDVGNPPTKTSDTGLVVINFDKHMRTAKCIGELQRFQIPYRLHEVPDLAEWIDAQLLRVREKDQAANAQTTHYRKSLMLEPREAQLRTPEGPSPATTSGMFGWMRSNSTSHGPGLAPPI